MDVILRETGVGGRDSQQPLHQVDQRDKQREQHHACDHDRDHDPDRGDRRPATHVAALVEGGDVDQHDQRDKKKRAQYHRQENLPRQFFAMAFV